MRFLSTLAVALLVPLAVQAAPKSGLTGHYIEARTCDVWTGPCFANAETTLGGKHAVLGWKVESGTLAGVKLDGLGVVAVVASSDTLGLEQTGPAKAVLIVDRRADAKQKDALVQLAKKQGGDLVKNVVAVERADIDLIRCPCTNDSCAILKAGKAKIETKCLGDNHKVCGNESAYYPPLSGGVKVKAALTVENSYTGRGFNETWQEKQRRSAYVGTFEMR